MAQGGTKSSGKRKRGPARASASSPSSSPKRASRKPKGGGQSEVGTEAKALRPLNPQQRLFVVEYLVDLNATQAATRAGYSPRTAEQIGYQLLQHPSVRAAVDEALAKRVARVEVTQDMVLQKWWQIATADPRELIELRRFNCRHCHGIDHAYQWEDATEFARACVAALANEKAKAPLDDGGYGFRKNAAPHPDCPRCGGDGNMDIHAFDTRALSPSAAALYAGAKLTQSGFEIKMRDQDAALANVAKHLGMFTEKHEHTGELTVEIVRFSDPAPAAGVAHA